jgi:hypothetical protein
MAKSKKRSILEVAVAFGGVSIGEKTARVSMKIARGESGLDIVAAEDLFCGRRLTGRIQLGGKTDTPGQTKFIETDVVVDGTFDIHRFGVTPEAFTTGATFSLKEIDIGDLAQFSKGQGRMVVNDKTEIPHDAIVEDADDDDNEKTLPGTFTQDKPWRKVLLDTLFVGQVLKALKAAGLATVGDLHDYQQPSKSGFIKQLADIKGLGPAKVQIIEDRMLEFWRDNPQD